MKRIAITGAGGFVGRALTTALVAHGHEVIALGRDPATLDVPGAVERRTFDASNGPNPSAFAGADAVVHLAGESVAGRWTPKKKRAIFESRQRGTHAAVESCAMLDKRPESFICASATGYYGSRGDESLDESSKAGEDFLARVCVAWEREASMAAGAGMRAVSLRTGIVLGNGGALEQMQLPFKLGAGGPFGSGKQFVPWIHLDDLIELYRFVIERGDIRGPVNAVAPDYATSARFSQALGMALHRPALLPAPAFALRAVLGEFSETLLESQLVIPAIALDAGFQWRHANLEGAMHGIYRSGDRSGAIQSVEAETFLPHPIERVFEFFSDARNLEAITPASLRFRISSTPQHLQRGAQIAYRLRLHGIPVSWKTLISRWNPPHEFEDVQLHGPYAFWQHRHRFEQVAGGTTMRDAVQYVLPFQPISGIASSFVAADVQEIFAHRCEAVEAALNRAT